MVSFSPVVERTIVDTPPPWPVLGDAKPFHVRLSASMADSEVGSVVWQLAHYNGVPVEAPVEIATPVISSDEA